MRGDGAEGGEAVTYLERKLAKRCTERGCPREALDDNDQCREHRDAHRARNRRWKRLLAFRREQLLLGLPST